MELFRHIPKTVEKVGLFPGTFNPPTAAHMALARSALDTMDEVVFVLPRIFPHKSYEGPSFPERMRMLLAAVEREARWSVASVTEGLFVDIARAARQHYPGTAEFHFICGRDAAERIVSWDYGRPGAIDEILQEFGLLVAARMGDYVPPPALRGRVSTLEVGEDFDDVSATEVRRRIAAREEWRSLVPHEIWGEVERLYGAE